MKTLDIKKVKEIVEKSSSYPPEIFTFVLLGYIFESQGDEIIDLISEYIKIKNQNNREKLYQKSLGLDCSFVLVDLKKLNKVNLPIFLHALNGIEKPYSENVQKKFDKIKEVFLANQQEFTQDWLNQYNLTELIKDFKTNNDTTT